MESWGAVPSGIFDLLGSGMVLISYRLAGWVLGWMEGDGRVGDAPLFATLLYCLLSPSVPPFLRVLSCLCFRGTKY